MQPIAPKPFVHQLVLYHWLQLLSFLLSISFYWVRDSAPVGVAPEAIAEFFLGIGSKI
jgi:hypothetical protein